MKAIGIALPLKKFLEEKMTELKELQEYRLTDVWMLEVYCLCAGRYYDYDSEEKVSIADPEKYSSREDSFKQLHLAAVSSGNEADAQMLEEQLEQLQELAHGSRIKTVSRENEMFLKVNERNRRINMVEMREAERRGVEERRKTGISLGALINLSFIGGFRRYWSIFTKKDHTKNLLWKSFLF